MSSTIEKEVPMRWFFHLSCKVVILRRNGRDLVYAGHQMKKKGKRILSTFLQGLWMKQRKSAK